MSETMHADKSRKGATFIARRSSSNPQQVVIDLVERYGPDDKDKLFDKFDGLADGDVDLLRAIKWYAFTNFYEYVATSRSNHSYKTPAERAAAAADHAAKVRDIKSQVIGLSLQFIMPNGERLADCTGTYCAKLGGSMAKIGAKVGMKRVGDVLTDKDLAAFQ